MHARKIVSPAALVLSALIAALAACGGSEDLSPGEQDVSFRVAMAPQPPLEQGGGSTSAVQVMDDDTANEPTDAEPFTAAVDLRLVAPMPPGVTADANRNPIRPGEVAALEVRASADAQAGWHQLLVAGQISGSSTTRFFPHRVTVTATCAPATEDIARVFPSAFGRTVALTRSGTAYLWGVNRLPPEAQTPTTPFPPTSNPVPETLDFYTAQRIDGLPPAISAASTEGVTAFVLQENGALIMVARFYRSPVRAPGGSAGWHIVSPAGATGYRQVVATSTTFFLLRDDDTVWRFESSAARDEAGRFAFSPPQQVPGFSDVVQLAAGGNHLLARRRDGTVMAFGSNDQGQLGDGTTAPPLGPIVVPGLTGITDIAAGGAFSLALRPNGTVVAWGAGGQGQLGNRFNANATIPVEVVTRNGSPISNILALAAGTSHAVALVADASLWSWGSGDVGQLGAGTPPAQPFTQAFAERVVGVSADRISAAGNSSFAVTFASATVDGWGDNLNGRLGDGTTTTRNTSIRALGLGRGEGIDCREPAPGPSAVVFEDGNFINSNWQAVITAMPISGPQATAARDATSGNPGAYRRMTDTLGQGPASLEVFHQNLTAVYDPRVQGAIDRIDYSDDRILFGELPTTTDPIGADLAFRQGDRVYKPNQIVEVGNNTWQRYERNGLRRVDFIQVSGPLCGENEMCPNFSSTGTEIVFGYWRFSAILERASVSLFTHGIDNWRVTVHPVP